MISSILTFFGALLKPIGEWMGMYGNAQAREARVIDEEKKKKDQFNHALAAQSIEEVRKVDN